MKKNKIKIRNSQNNDSKLYVVANLVRFQQADEVRRNLA
jgi:hypothetical protein